MWKPLSELPCYDRKFLLKGANPDISVIQAAIPKEDGTFDGWGFGYLNVYPTHYWTFAKHETSMDR